MQRPFLRRIAFPSKFRQKAPHSAGKRAFRPVCSRILPAAPPRLRARSGFRVPRADSAPAQRPHACPASARRLGFRIPAQVPRSGAGSASRLGSCIPAHLLSSGAGATFRNIVQAPPFRKHPPLRRPARRDCAFSLAPVSSPLSSVFLKRKSPLERGALFLNENQFSHLPFT